MRTVVGVLRGGPSSEYEVSLKSGASILNALNREKYEPRDLFIDKQGTWHLHGVAVPPERALRGVDVVFNVIHGEYGEDGQLHRILESFAVPYTGSGLDASVLAFNKHHTNEAVKKLGFKVPPSIVVHEGGDLEAKAFKIFRSFPHPAIIKPIIGGSSVGMTVADSYYALESGLQKAFSVAPAALVEEYIKGKEATVGVVENFRNERLYTLMPVEIVPPARHGFFNYDAKYSGETVERVPGSFSDKEKNELMHIARSVHDALGMQHYSRSDFIVSKRGIYFLEVNNAAAVGMTEQSLMPKAIEAVGSKLSDFVDHIVMLALGRAHA
jgi:D-alanine-D-alanine ligase